MGFLASILSQWRMAVLGLAAAGLLIAGWTVNGWRQDAARLGDARAALRTAQERMAKAQRAAVQANEDRAKLGKELSEAEAALETRTTQARTVIRRVVQTDPRCDLEPSLVRILRDARAGSAIVPPAPDNAPNAPGASGPTPGG